MWGATGIGKTCLVHAVAAALERELIEVNASDERGKAEIAAVIGISVPTLNLHFAFELTEGAAKKKAAIYRALEKNALAGNVSAQKAMILQFEKAAAVPQATRARKEPAPGKKELLEREAMEAPATPRWGNLIQ